MHTALAQSAPPGSTWSVAEGRTYWPDCVMTVQAKKSYLSGASGNAAIDSHADIKFVHLLRLADTWQMAACSAAAIN